MGFFGFIFHIFFVFGHFHLYFVTYFTFLSISVIGAESGVFEIRDYTDNLDVTEKACQGCLKCYIYASYFHTERSYDWVWVNDLKWSGDYFPPQVVTLDTIGKRLSLIFIFSRDDITYKSILKVCTSIYLSRFLFVI